MILQAQENKITRFGGQVTETSIDVEQLSKIKGILSTSLYSDKYSFAREYSSNICDANLEHNISKKGVIGIKSDRSGYYVYFQDFSSGISPTFMRDCFSKFGWSSKENSNILIGFYGLGRVSGLSFTNKVYFITNVDSIKYTYELSKVNGATFTLLNEEETNEENGTTVKVYLVEQGYYGRQEMEKNIKKHCSYFEGIDCNLFTSPLYKSDAFWYSEDFEGDNNTHLAYGGCYYKIPYEEFDIPKITIPVALPIPIGKLTVPPNREQIDLTLDNKKVIQEAIDKFLTHCRETAKTEFDDLKEYYASMNSGSFKLVSNLRVKYSQVDLEKNLIYKPLKEVQELTKINDFYPDFVINKVVKTRLVPKYRLLREKSDWIRNITNLLLKDVNHLNEKYFREYVEDEYVIELNDVTSYSHKLTLRDWVKFFKLDKVPKTKWRFIITAYLKWFKEHHKLKTFSEVKKSQEFKDFVTEQRKKQTYYRSKPIEGSMTVARKSKSKGDSGVVFEKRVVNTTDYITVTNKTPSNRIEFLFSLIQNTNTLMIKGKEENLKDILSSSLVYKSLMAYKIHEFFSTKDKAIKLLKIIKQKEDVYQELRDFKIENLCELSSKINETEFYKELENICATLDFTDPIEDKLNELKQYLIDNPHIELIANVSTEGYKQEELIKLANFITSK